MAGFGVTTEDQLASVRYAARIEPVDDLYYAAPQQVPVQLTPIGTGFLKAHLHRARVAASYTLRYAEELDRLLDCNWRQGEVQARIDRIDQIFSAT